MDGQFSRTPKQMPAQLETTVAAADPTKTFSDPPHTATALPFTAHIVDDRSDERIPHCSHDKVRGSAHR